MSGAYSVARFAGMRIAIGQEQHSPVTFNVKLHEESL